MRRSQIELEIVAQTNAATKEVYKTSRNSFIAPLTSFQALKLDAYKKALLHSAWRCQTWMEAIVKLDDPSTLPAACSCGRGIMELLWDMLFLMKFKEDAPRYHQFSDVVKFKRHEFHLEKKKNDPTYNVPHEVELYVADTATFNTHKELTEKFFVKGRNFQFSWTGFNIKEQASRIGEIHGYETLYKFLSMNIHAGPTGNFGTQHAILDLFVSTHFITIMTFIQTAGIALTEIGGYDDNFVSMKEWKRQLLDTVERQHHLEKLIAASRS